MTDTLIWIFLLFVFLIIIGLYTSEFTPLDLTDKQKALSLSLYEKFSNQKQSENFAPSVSSDSSVETGASRYYDWGLPDNNVYHPNKNQFHQCNKNCPVKCPFRELSNITINNCTQSNVNLNDICSKCDITSNKDIDKYVLKSSIPPCPDMSEYVTKNMINANTDLSDYILKSEIKPCEKVDLTNYILKSEIPACPNCPICPECPICPVCPPQQECKKIYQYDIVEHPGIQNYISKDDLNKNYMKIEDVNNNYIKKSDLCTNPYVQQYMSQNCPKPTSTISSSNNDLNKNYMKLEDVNNNYIKKSDLSNHPDVKKYISNIFQNIPLLNNKNKKTSKKNDILSEEYQSELLRNDIKGYYVGDSAFSGV
jgi:hypothetical protein